MNISEWKSVAFDFPDHIPTMISTEEKQYLYWLGSSVWQGVGLIVEFGPWLGGSTWCLAAGMQDSGFRSYKRYVVYDNFIWREFMSDRASLTLKPGDFFQAEFLNNIGKYKSIISSYKCALPDEIISNDQEAESKRYTSDEYVVLFHDVPGADPVEILFVDGAKSWLGFKHLLLNISARLIPGRSILVFQDFKYWGTYWVPLMLNFLGDYLQPIHNVTSATTVTFRLLKPISRKKIEVLPNHIADVATDDSLTAIDHAAQMLRVEKDDLGAANVQLGKVMFLSHQGKLDQAVTAFRESQTNWPTYKEVTQLERARKYLAKSQSVYIAPNLTMSVKQQAWRMVKRVLR